MGEELAWVLAQEVGAAEEVKECGLTSWERRSPRADTDGSLPGPADVPPPSGPCMGPAVGRI